MIACGCNRFLCFIEIHSSGFVTQNYGFRNRNSTPRRPKRVPSTKFILFRVDVRVFNIRYNDLLGGTNTYFKSIWNQNCNYILTPFVRVDNFKSLKTVCESIDCHLISTNAVRQGGSRK